MPAFLLAIVQSLIAAGLIEAAAAVIAKWKATGDADAAAAEAGHVPTMPAQAPTVGRMRRNDFEDEWGSDPLVLECRLDALLRRCE